MKGWLPRRTLPVLMYHRLGSCPGGDPQLWVTEETFALHLMWIRNRGLRTLSLDEAYESFRSGSFSSKAVLITFDDAFANVLDHALPVMGELGVPATVFAVTGNLGPPPGWEIAADHPDAHETTMTPGEIRQAAAGGGVTFGSHGATHRRLTDLSPDEVYWELKESRTATKKSSW